MVKHGSNARDARALHRRVLRLQQAAQKTRTGETRLQMTVEDLEARLDAERRGNKLLLASLKNFSMTHYKLRRHYQKLCVHNKSLRRVAQRARNTNIRLLEALHSSVA